MMHIKIYTVYKMNNNLSIKTLLNFNIIETEQYFFLAKNNTQKCKKKAQYLITDILKKKLLRKLDFSKFHFLRCIKYFLENNAYTLI